jgi:hypothetical protein
VIPEPDLSDEKPKAEPTIRMSTRPQANNKRTESLNHLLNFTLPPRSQPLAQNVPRRSRKPNNVYYNPESESQSMSGLFTESQTWDTQSL